MNCKFYRQEIEHTDFAQAMSADAARHIESCAACRAFKQEHDSLQSLIGNLERVAAPANFDANLRARINASKTHHGGAFTWLNFSLLRPAVGVCLALPLLIGGLMIFVSPLLMNENQPLNTAAKALEIKKTEDINEETSPSPKRDDMIAGDNEGKQHNRLSPHNSREQRRANDGLLVRPAPENERILTPDSANDTISIAIRPESRSPYLMLKDKKVPIRSVSFGSPTFVSGNAQRTNSSSDSEGIW